MKKLFAFILLTGLIVSCTSSPDPALEEAEAAAKAKAEEHVTVVKKYLAAFESGEFESWREICTDDFITYGPKIDDKGNLDDYIKNMLDWVERTDSVETMTIGLLPQTIEEGEYAGDYVLWWGVNSMYVIEAEKNVKIMLHTVFKMKDGMIEWERDYWDTGDVKQQLADDEKKMKEEV